MNISESLVQGHTHSRFHIFSRVGWVAQYVTYLDYIKLLLWEQLCDAVHFSLFINKETFESKQCWNNPFFAARAPKTLFAILTNDIFAMTGGLSQIIFAAAGYNNNNNSATTFLERHTFCLKNVRASNQQLPHDFEAHAWPRICNDMKPYDTHQDATTRVQWSSHFTNLLPKTFYQSPKFLWDIETTPPNGQRNRYIKICCRQLALNFYHLLKIRLPSEGPFFL